MAKMIKYNIDQIKENNSKLFFSSSDFKETFDFYYEINTDALDDDEFYEIYKVDENGIEINFSKTEFRKICDKETWLEMEYLKNNLTKKEEDYINTVLNKDLNEEKNINELIALFKKITRNIQKNVGELFEFGPDREEMTIKHNLKELTGLLELSEELKLDFEVNTTNTKIDSYDPDKTNKIKDYCLIKGFEYSVDTKKNDLSTFLVKQDEMFDKQGIDKIRKFISFLK